MKGQQVGSETENDGKERNYRQWCRQIGGNILSNQGAVFSVNQLIIRGG